MTRILLILPFLLFASCAQQSFPMRNPQTGEQVVCGSGLTWQSQKIADATYGGGPGSQSDVLEACIHACERFGFRADGLEPFPATPPRDMAVLLPKACK